MTKTTTVILFGGLPASGKSTLARNIQEYYYMLNNNTNKKVIHLEYDALEDEIVSKQQQQDEGEDRILAWNQARYVAVQNLERIIAKHQKDDDMDNNNDNHDETSLVILLDDNFHLRGMRKQIHRKLLNIKNRHDKNIRFGIIWMDTDLEMCLERNSNRQQQPQQPQPQQRRNIEKHVIQKMNRVMELPTNYWEGYWIYGNQVTFSNLIDFIENCDDIQDVKEEDDDDHDPEQQERDRKKTLDNLRHSCDKLLRSWVGKVAKYDKSLASSANIARKELLVLLKDDNDSSSTEEQLLTSFLDLIGKSHAETKDDKLRALLLTNHKTNIEKH